MGVTTGMRSEHRVPLEGQDVVPAPARRAPRQGIPRGMAFPGGQGSAVESRCLGALRDACASCGVVVAARGWRLNSGFPAEPQLIRYLRLASCSAASPPPDGPLCFPASPGLPVTRRLRLRPSRYPVVPRFPGLPRHAPAPWRLSRYPAASPLPRGFPTTAIAGHPAAGVAQGYAVGSAWCGNTLL